MRQIIIILALLALWPGYVHAQINQDTVNSDVPGGGGSGSGLTESDIDTPAKLNAFVTPDLADISGSQSLTNKTIDAAANTIKILKGADCTTFDAAVDGQYCWDTDDDLLYVCETADVCDTAGEWDAVATVASVAMDDLTDVTETTPQDDDVLVYDTGVWVNKASCPLADSATDASNVTCSNCVEDGALASTFLKAADINPIADLNTVAGTTLKNFGTLTDGFLCTRDESGDDIDCNTDPAGFEPAGVTAAEVANTPSGDIGATDVQGAVNELDGEKVSLNGDVMQGILTLHSQGLTIADSGDGNPASDTTAPTGNDVYVTCNDTDGCNYTPSESGAVNNRAVTVWNTSANTLNMVPSAGVLVTCDTATYSLSQGQSTRIKYVTDSWYEVCESTDWADLRNVPAFRKTLVQLRPQANEPPASSFATMNTPNSHPALRFNGNVCAIWTFVMPNTYGGNGVTVDFWYVSTQTSNDTDWDGSWERIATTQDIDSDSFASAISADNNNNNATSGIPTKVSIAFTDGAQMDSCAADELCRFRLCRDDTSDTGGADTIDFLGGQIRETP